MRAGNLNKLITIENLVSGQDDFGQPLDNSWTKFKDVRASIVPVIRNVTVEAFSSNTDFTQTTHKIKMRYIQGVNASMRATFEGRVFDFIAVVNISERNREIEILAKENINGN